MKKRILTVFIALTMLIAMTGCGSRQEQNTSSDPATGEAAARTTETDKASDPLQEDAAKMPKEDDSSNTSGMNDPARPSEQADAEEPATEETGTEEVKAKMLRMMIGNTAVAVDWENNESVEALKAQCENEPLVIQMSMYGGFEQVGPIGSRLPSNDAQTTCRRHCAVLLQSDRRILRFKFLGLYEARAHYRSGCVRNGRPPQ